MTIDPNRKPTKSEMRAGAAMGKPSAQQSDPLAALEADERILWQGRIGFNFFSSPILTLALVGVTVFAIWALAGYVPNQSSGSGRQQFGNVAIRPALIVLLFFQTLAMLERRAVTTGRATGDIILTNRRLLRISTWPKLRVRAFDYVSKRVSGFGGVIWVGEFGWFTVAPNDAVQVRRLMNFQKTEAHP